MRVHQSRQVREKKTQRRHTSATENIKYIGGGLLMPLTFMAKSMNPPTEAAVRSATSATTALFVLALANRRRWPCHFRYFRSSRRIRSRALFNKNQRERGKRGFGGITQNGMANEKTLGKMGW